MATEKEIIDAINTLVLLMMECKEIKEIEILHRAIDVMNIKLN